MAHPDPGPDLVITMRSMTGFGEASGANERCRIAVCLRAVNHRHLDLVFHLKEEYQASGVRLREVLSSELARGRVEVGVEVEPLVPPRLEVRVRREVVEALGRELHELRSAGLLVGSLEARDLLSVPAALEVEPEAAAWGEAESSLLEQVTREALGGLVAAREREGGELSRLLRQRIDELGGQLVALESRRRSVTETLFENLRERLTALLEDREVDPDRLAQEAALLVERSDVAEELDRLRAHLEHFLAVLEQTGPIGRRLGFLTQEIGRELNTVGAKCRDSEMSRRVLDARVLCEQLREQIQNVE